MPDGMRELKFRVRDTETKKIYPPEEICRFHFNEGLLYAVALWNGDVILKPEPIEYTGLKDRNGKEIYEGDIFEIEGIRSFVVYWETSAGFRFNSYMPLGYIDRLYDASHVGEIIGNIYENPELLAEESHAR